ncbi:hypothetical protein PVAP13_5KG292156 [Panicum virgatum]|uniref:Uncharacterized protein n=1 Tax=Panicum virgatum TaxID=38727 RepID=A0A8T0SI55_PANVG|nr:hypothetical protein PVAP13_5KG292156 [Panicum virgatum]
MELAHVSDLKKKVRCAPFGVERLLPPFCVSPLDSPDRCFLDSTGSSSVHPCSRRRPLHASSSCRCGAAAPLMERSVLALQESHDRHPRQPLRMSSNSNN